MNKTTALCIVLALLLTVPCGASGYPWNLWDSWMHCSIVLLGKPLLDPISGKYSMQIMQTLKGDLREDLIQFNDENLNSTAMVNILPLGGKTYLVCLQTQSDRDKDHHEKSQGLTVLQAFEATKDTLPQIHDGIQAIKDFEGLSSTAKKTFLLERLEKKNEFIQSSIVREVLLARYPEAIQLFRQQLSQAKTDREKLGQASNLRILGDPLINAQVIGWLEDPEFTAKQQAIDELVKAKNPTAALAIAKYVNSKDEIVASEARSALLQLGDDSAKELLLKVLANSKNAIARYIAIHTLNWNYRGVFTEDEKKAIERLSDDQDESVARVAKMIADKWKGH